jgi:transcriptional regulator with XRE-family HTH domain
MIWTLDDYLKQLPKDQRKRVESRAKEIAAEELTLCQLRKAMRHSQTTLAELLGVKQAEVCRLERRTDMYLSTLRRYVEAMGGQLELRASFPTGGAVLLKDFSSLGPFDDNADLNEPKQQPKPKKIVQPSRVVKRTAAGATIKPAAEAPAPISTTRKKSKRA